MYSLKDIIFLILERFFQLTYFLNDKVVCILVIFQIRMVFNAIHFLLLTG